jgi:histidinol-phosphate aminotransferase
MQLSDKSGAKLPAANEDIMSIKPYVQGKSVIPEFDDPIKLSSNESSHGPSPKALEAFNQTVHILNRYPDGTHEELRRAISEVYNLNFNKIVCGNGSEDLIGLLIRAYIKPGDDLILSENHFIMCPIYGKAQSAIIIYAKEKDFTTQVDSILDSMNENTRMIILANPNNPTGTYVAWEEVKRLLENIPDDVMLVIDEAYAEYVVKDDYNTALSIVDEFENVIVTRTFSKIYGLAGLRIGWAYCPDHVIDTLNRLRSPFTANCAALAAATAAMKDVEYTENVRDHNALWLDKIAQDLNATGLKVIPSVANFYLISFEDAPGKSAVEAASYLESKGIIPRPTNSKDDTLRITVGLDHENEAVIQTLTEYMSH